MIVVVTVVIVVMIIVMTVMMIIMIRVCQTAVMTVLYHAVTIVIVKSLLLNTFFNAFRVNLESKYLVFRKIQ